MLRTLMAVLFVISLPAFADHKKDREGDGDRGGGKACAPVKTACEKAGYTSGRKGGGLGSIRDCVQNWATGAQIKGITLRVNDPALKDCLAHVKQKEKQKIKDGVPPAAPGALSGAKPPQGHGTGSAKLPSVPANAPKVLPMAPQPPAPQTPPPKKP